MARSDLVLGLVRSGTKGDRDAFQRVVEALIADERGKRHTTLAAQLEETLKTSRNGTSNGNGKHGFRQMETEVERSVIERLPRKTIGDLVLTDQVRENCMEFIQEQHRVEILRSYSIEPRNRVLLVGPPGNGKTSLAEAIATELSAPFLIVRYDAVVGQYLGETASRLRKVIEYAKTRHCVLFFDEFETIGKERGDTNETGEIKRVVSSLLLQIDDLPSHVVVVAATNHSELLDRAAWRRFQLRLRLDSPTVDQLTLWFSRFFEAKEVDFGVKPEAVARAMKQQSFAEAEEFALSLMRRYVLGIPDSRPKTIYESVLKLWRSRVERHSENLD